MGTGRLWVLTLLFCSMMAALIVTPSHAQKSTETDVQAMPLAETPVAATEESAETVEEGEAEVTKVRPNVIWEIIQENPLEPHEQPADHESDTKSGTTSETDPGDQGTTGTQDAGEAAASESPEADGEHERVEVMTALPDEPLAVDPASTPSSDIVARTIDEQMVKLLTHFKLTEILLALLATALFVMLVRWVNELFAFIHAQTGRWLLSAFPDGFQLNRLKLLSSGRLKDTVDSIVTILNWFLVLFIFYWYLTLVFSFFPETRYIAQVLVHYTVQVIQFIFKSFVVFMPNVLSIAVIAVVSYYIIQFVHYLAVQIATQRFAIRGFHRDWAMPTYKIIQFFVIVFAMIMIFPYLPGFDSPSFRAVGVFLGVLLSLGSSSAVANIIAGMVLIYMRPFRVGDYVRMHEVQGEVSEMSLLVTRVRTSKNEEVTLPNSKVLADSITNFSTDARSRGLVLHSKVTIGYDVDWRQVHELLLTAARETEGVLETPEPYVLQKSLDDYSVCYEINAYTDQPAAMPRTYSELHKHILDQFNTAGVEILSPMYNAMRDGNELTLFKTAKTVNEK